MRNLRNRKRNVPNPCILVPKLADFSILLLLRDGIQQKYRQIAINQSLPFLRIKVR